MKLEADKWFVVILIGSILLIFGAAYVASEVLYSRTISVSGRIFLSENLALYMDYDCTQPPANETWGEIPRESNSTALRFYLKNIGNYTITELQIEVGLHEEHIHFKPYLHFYQSFYDFQWGNWNERLVYMEPEEVVEFYIVCEVDENCPKGDFAVDMWVLEADSE